MRGTFLAMLAILGCLAAWSGNAPGTCRPRVAESCCCDESSNQAACACCVTVTPDVPDASRHLTSAESCPPSSCPCCLSAPRDFAPAILPLGLGTMATSIDRIGDRPLAPPLPEFVRSVTAPRAVAVEARLSTLCRWRI